PRIVAAFPALVAKPRRVPADFAERLEKLRGKARKDATQSSAGLPVTSSNVPTWTMVPSRIRARRSASAAASSRSWVTTSAVTARSARISSISVRSRLRKLRSRSEERRVGKEDTCVGGDERWQVELGTE